MPSLSRLLFLLAILTASPATAAIMLSELDESECTAEGYMWMRGDGTCVEVDPTILGDWHHVGSNYPDIGGPFTARWNYRDVPHAVWLEISDGIVTLETSHRESTQVLIWGLDGAQDSNIVGIVLASREKAIVRYVPAAQAATDNALLPLRDLGTFAAADTLYFETAQGGVHFFRRKGAPRQFGGAGRPLTSPCYAMFAAQHRLSECVLESPNQFSGQMPNSVGRMAVQARFEVLTGHYNFAGCLFAGEACNFSVAMSRALMDIVGQAPFLVSTEDEADMLHTVEVYSTLAERFAAEEARIHRDIAKRMEDLEFIYDAVAVDGTETVARGLFDPGAKARATREVAEAMFTGAVCLAVSNLNPIGDVQNIAGSLVGGACSSRSVVKSIFDYLESKEIPRASDTPHSPTILHTKLYFKALVQDYGDLQLEQLRKLRQLAYGDETLARGLYSAGLEQFFPRYDAAPMKRMLWQAAIDNFGLLKPHLFFQSPNLASAQLDLDGLCSENVVLVTAAPASNTEELSGHSNGNITLRQPLLGAFEQVQWVLHAGRPVESRPVSDRAVRDLAASMSHQEVFDALKDRMYMVTPYAVEISASDSGFSGRRDVTLDITRRDASAIIPFTFDSDKFRFGTLIIEEALNPVTRTASAEYKYIAGAPVAHHVCK